MWPLVIFAGPKKYSDKAHVVTGEGTYAVVIEKNWLQLFREVQILLEEPW